MTGPELEDETPSEEPGESDYIDEPDEPGLNNDFDWTGGD